jgi:hypothetical protein
MAQIASAIANKSICFVAERLESATDFKNLWCKIGQNHERNKDFCLAEW